MSHFPSLSFAVRRVSWLSPNKKPARRDHSLAPACVSRKCTSVNRAYCDRCQLGVVHIALLLPSFRGTHASEVIAARRPGYGIELSAQADLAACICHSTGAASKRDQRRETALS